MQSFGTAPASDANSHPATDWHDIFVHILGDALPPPTEDSAPPSPATQDAIDGLVVHSRLLFAGAHNAGFYINSYTTKLNPGMDTVLQRLLEGVRRLHTDWAASQATGGHAAAKAHGKPEAPGDPATGSSGAAPRGPPGAFGRTAQMLARFDTSFRRASWKSGAEMVFPMLFGHMSFMTHRCWCVLIRKAFWYGAQSWRMF